MENRKADFSEWYNEIVEIAELSDKRYNVKGMNVWMPYGLKLMQNIDRIMRDIFDESSFQEVSFPVPITKDQLMVEFDHVKGFEGELFWITKGGHEELDVQLALRPTSEAAMYPMLALWIRSHADLPMKLYQIVSVYRHETKHTRSFIRIREIHFFEAHTAHATFDDAEDQMSQYRSLWERLASYLSIPFITTQRPEWDKFPGAMYTLAFDTIMPSSRTLQIGTIHQYGTNFSKNYKVEYSDDNGDHHFVSQTTFGMSERLLAAVIGLHGDDKGLILPPSIAPVQFIIVPIPSDEVDTTAYAREVSAALSEKKLRSRVDDRDNYTPGYKYNDWEMRGVPIRIEIGSREVLSNNVTLALRPVKGKRTLGKSEFLSNPEKHLDEVREILRERSSEQFNSMIKVAENVKDMKKVTGAVIATWCGSKECADKIEEATDKSALGHLISESENGKCLMCGSNGLKSLFAKSY